MKEWKEWNRKWKKNVGCVLFVLLWITLLLVFGFVLCSVLYTLYGVLCMLFIFFSSCMKNFVDNFFPSVSPLLSWARLNRFWWHKEQDFNCCKYKRKRRGQARKQKQLNIAHGVEETSYQYIYSTFF